jgi:hypothetical protein
MLTKDGATTNVSFVPIRDIHGRFTAKLNGDASLKLPL